MQDGVTQFFPLVDTDPIVNPSQSTARSDWSRFVVTGGSGFLGRSVMSALRSRGLVAVSASRREGVDLRDGQAAVRFFNDTRPHCVIHCAAHMGGIGYVREHGIEVYRDNLQISMGLLEGMAGAGLRNLITIMPNCTYPARCEVFCEPEWWDGPLHDSVLMYGLPRKAFWGLCWTYAQQGLLRPVHLVLPNLYGPHDHMDPVRSHALGAIAARVVAAQAVGESEITLWGTGAAIREWLYVEDAARAVVRMKDAFSDSRCTVGNNELFNVGLAEGVSIRDLAMTVARLAGWTGRFSFDPSRPEGATRKVLNGTRFRALTHWRPEVTLEEGISRTLTWYRQSLDEQLAGSSQ